MNFTSALIAATVILTSAAGAADMKEPPYLAAQVAAGKLPAVSERLPEMPHVTDLAALGKKPGKYGGVLRTLVGREKDIRLMNVYGYSRLVGYDADINLQPDILESYEVDDSRIFTLHLRKGHRWSDGHPFTAEDFRYYWEDVANNVALSPVGPPEELMLNKQPPIFRVIDETTVQYEYAGPNPYFLSQLAAPRPTYLYRPAHYLKQFHEKYADPATLAALVEEHRRKNWAQLHNRIGHMYNNSNTALPTLEPWVVATEAPADRYSFTRNPYFHRVDSDGHQLPYIDEISMSIAASGVVPIKAGTGETDLQGRGLAFADFTFLKQNEERYGYNVNLWRLGLGSVMALYPNLNTSDAEYRKLFRDVRFRRALSMAINRDELNEVLFYGLAIPAANTVLPSSPLFREDYQQAWSTFDPDAANALLDDIGLTKRNDDGLRLLPDGRAIEITVETAGERPQQVDALQLVKDSWLEIGVRIFVKNSPRETFRNRIFSGETLISVWPGLDNGAPTADDSPSEIAPISQQHLQWPKWGQYVETYGKSGEPVDMPEAMKLAALYKDWTATTTTEARREIWHEMLKIHADQVYTIGTVCCSVQPVVTKAGLENVPQEGLWAWAPTAQFGIYRPDTFFWSNQ